MKSQSRLANFDLLRILVMFLILVIHANYLSLPKTTYETIVFDPLGETVRLFIEFIGVCAVNVFVLISGWFGIRPTIKKTLCFIFQILFFWFGIFLIKIISGVERFSVHGLSDAIFFSTWDWFIKAYIVLYILSPVLNTFIEYANEKLVRNILIAFFIFEFTYGWIGGGYLFFTGGYGTLSFIGLYLLAAYVKKIIYSKDYSTKKIHSLFSFNIYIYLFIYLFVAIMGVLLCLVNYRYELIAPDLLFKTLLYYNSPFMVVEALTLMIFFSKINVNQSTFLSRVSLSTFAVYLFHSEPLIRDLFNTAVSTLYYSNTGVLRFGYIFLFLVLVFIVSIFIDQLRILFWNLLTSIKEK